MRPYYCHLPMFGRADHVEFVMARNVREARKLASRQHDEYANRGISPGHRRQVTPASHWVIVR